MLDRARILGRSRTARRSAGAARRFLRAHYEDVLASLGDGLVLLDLEERVVFLSPDAEDLLGVSASHARGRDAREIFAQQPWLLETVAKLDDSRVRWASEVGELTAPLERRVAVHLSAGAVVDAVGTVIGRVLLLRDLATERSLAETSERNTRVAELTAVAAGLAHEIKNPLGGIKGAAQLLAETLTDDADAARFTALIVREVDRVSALLEELLELTRPPRLRFAATNVHRILQDVLHLEQAAANGTLAIHRHFDPSLPDVWADEAQLRQVFLNLVRNALEAMGGSGALTITTRLEIDSRLRTRGDGQHRRFVWVEIEDTGAGIAPEYRERIFTPFFTTKARGTGLGLAVSQRVVAQHGGRIQVDSRPGNGTRVRVSLPVATGEEDV